jgi:hypothetical protein
MRDLELENTQDSDQLRLLSIFHFINAGIVGLFSLFPLIHIAFGIGILNGAFDGGSNRGGPPPAFIGWILILFPMVFIAMGLTMAICITVAGRNIGRRTGHLFCIVVAGLECMFMPFGTVLGVLTILVLMRPSVKLLFGVSADPTISRSR